MQSLLKRVEELKTKEAGVEEEIGKARANQDATLEQKAVSLSEKKQQVESLQNQVSFSILTAIFKN